MQTPTDKISAHVSVAAQSLKIRAATGETLRRYPVSTSRYGVGTEPGSLRTPLGRFRVAQKIGDEAPAGMIFSSRVATGEIGLDLPDADLVLTRILWLEGLEDHNANTFERYIYIHGTNHETHVGRPASHGCVRMKNTDVIELYTLLPVGTEIIIEEH